jgi:hypothetical protein
MKCPNCQASNAGLALFCHTCGRSLGPQDAVDCENHSGTTATGICAICGKPVCDDCSVSHEGRVYCDDVRHSQLSSAFTRFAFAATEFEGDLIAKNLLPNGISVMLFSATRYAHFCRLTDQNRVSIYAGIGQVDDAKRLLADSGLMEFLSIENNSP